MPKTEFDKALPLNPTLAATEGVWPKGTIVTPRNVRGSYLVMGLADPVTTPKTAPLFILAHMSDSHDFTACYPWAYLPFEDARVADTDVDLAEDQKLFLVAGGKWSNVPDKTGPRRVIGSVLNDNLIHFGG